MSDIREQIRKRLEESKTNGTYVSEAEWMEQWRAKVEAVNRPIIEALERGIRESKMRERCIRIEEFTGHAKPVWHVFRGPCFVGAFSTREQAEQMVEMLCERG